MLLVGIAWLVGRNRPPHQSGKSLLQRLPLPPRIDLPAAGLAGVSLPGPFLVRRNSYSVPGHRRKTLPENIVVLPYRWRNSGRASRHSLVPLRR